MEKEFIPYEQALELKELGFDEPCILLYRGLDTQPVCQMDYEFKIEKNSDFNDETNYWLTVPLYQQAFRWFREKHNLLGGVYSNASGWAWEIHDNVGGTHRFASEYTGDCLYSGMFTSFEKAELECLKKLIEIVKNK
jgi:hypothetical protein